MDYPSLLFKLSNSSEGIWYIMRFFTWTFNSLWTRVKRRILHISNMQLQFAIMYRTIWLNNNICAISASIKVINKRGRFKMSLSTPLSPHKTFKLNSVNTVSNNFLLIISVVFQMVCFF